IKRFSRPASAGFWLPESGSTRHSSTLRGTCTAPGMLPSRARTSPSRVSTSVAPSRMASAASGGVRRRSLACAAARTSLIERRVRTLTASRTESHPDRMPDRLELEERRDLVRALPVGTPADDPLYVLRTEPLELREVAVCAGDGIRRSDYLRELVRPARVPDDAIDRALDLVRATREPGELRAARLHHLGDAIDHLAAVVRGHPRPARARLTRDPNCVAEVLARPARDVRALRVVRAAGVGARERAPDEELVGLADREAA